MKKRKQRPPNHRRLGNITTPSQKMAIILQLLNEPHRTMDLAAKLNCSRDAIERLLKNVRDAGLPLKEERRGEDGREIWHSIEGG